MTKDQFEVTEEHIKLLGRLEIGYDHYTEFGAPEVDPKRPYGNSDVPNDIYEILGWDPSTSPEAEEEDGYWSIPYDDERAMTIHLEMKRVLQILCDNLGIQPGLYERKRWSGSWTLVQREEES